jgi:hypothetical protein
MHRLAELRPDLAPPGAQLQPRILQARLLGVGGLLPIDLPRTEAASDSYVRMLWDCWWREQEQYRHLMLPRAIWRFNGIRPANHPQRRLALVSHWLTTSDLVARLEKWLGSNDRTQDKVQGLLELLHVARDDFWFRHWTIRSKALLKSQPLIGLPRLTDLALNVVLPWALARADSLADAATSAQVQKLYLEWPGGEDNAVLKLARRRLLGTNSRELLRSGAAQQGLLQIVRDFCERSDAVCTNCRFPELVQHWCNQ